MHVLIAPNAFKNSLDAMQAAEAIGEGLQASRFAGTWEACPIGDGGDGTGALLLRQLGGVHAVCTVRDPLGRAIAARIGLIDSGRAAIIELAEASGLRHLQAHELDPLQATTFGTGQLITAALDRGVKDIVLCVGGSATVDGGTGILRALGLVLRDPSGGSLSPAPASLADLESVDASHLDPRLRECRLTILCDVTNPLVGPTGAAAIFGPQKGATKTAVATLDAALTRWGEVIAHETGAAVADLPRGGAAGGVAAGLHGMLGATLVDGIDYSLDRIGFDAALARADVVVTGEGSIDDQTTGGKGPWGVAVRARRRGAFVVGLAGHVPLQAAPTLRCGFDVLLPIGHRAMCIDDALACTGQNLRRTAIELGNLLALGAGAWSAPR